MHAISFHVLRQYGRACMMITNVGRTTPEVSRANNRVSAAAKRLNALNLVLTLVLGLTPALTPFVRQLPLPLLLGLGCIPVIQLLVRFKRWNDELVYFPRFVRSVVFLVAVVLVENFCTWATSASDSQKYEYTPLQDNVELLLLRSFDRYPVLQWLVVGGWDVDMHTLLAAFVALCLSPGYDAVPYSGFGMASRFMDTIAFTHLIRTVAFMITVLPNPQGDCYRKNFPPVPDTVSEYVAIGFGAKRGHGCNDLVISGHGAVYAACALAIATYSGRRGCGWLAWLGVFKLCLKEVVDKTHYSVDMFLAVVVTALVWVWRRHVYDADDEGVKWRERRKSSKKDPVPTWLVASVILVLLLVGVGTKGV